MTNESAQQIPSPATTASLLYWESVDYVHSEMTRYKQEEIFPPLWLIDFASDLLTLRGQYPVEDHNGDG